MKQAKTRTAGRERPQIDGTVVHRVVDGTVLQVVLELTRSHDGAVVLGLGRRRPQVWQDDGVSHVSGRGIRKVTHIASDKTVIERLGHGLLVHKHVTSKVKHHNTALHLPDGVNAYHAFRLIGSGHMDRDVVTLPKDLVDVRDVANTAIEPPCGVDGEVRIIAQGFHTKACGRIGNDGADGS